MERVRSSMCGRRRTKARLSCRFLCSLEGSLYSERHEQEPPLMKLKLLTIAALSWGALSEVSLAERPEEKIVDEELSVYETVTMEKFYIGDMSSLAYELHESQALEECSRILAKIANFARGEQNISRNPSAIKLLAKSEQDLLALSQELLTEKPSSLKRIEKAIGQVEKGLTLSYGKADNEALRKEVMDKDEKVLFSYRQAYNLQDVFEQVSELWSEKNPQEAVARLDKAIEFIASEVELSQSEEGKVALEAAHRELVAMRGRLTRREVKDVAELDAVYRQTHQALATAYQKRSLLAKFGDRKKRLQREAREQAEAAQKR